MAITPFHIAFPVDDLDAAPPSIAERLVVPRDAALISGSTFDLCGRQIVAHLKPSSRSIKRHHNPVDGHDGPVPHFGVVLSMQDWEVLADRLRAAKINFLIEPYIRFKSEVGEQATMFFLDPAGNALEFEAFAHIGQLFAK